MASENWQLTDDAATLYETYVYPLMLPWIDALTEKGKLAKGEHVLDVACGTGYSRLKLHSVLQQSYRVQ